MSEQQSEFERQEAEYQRLQEESTLSPKAQELFKHLFDFVNSGGSHRELAKLAKKIAKQPEHRTLQQNIIRLFMMTIEEMAALPQNAIDGRNQDSRFISKQMLEGFRKVRAEYDSGIHGRTIDDQANPSQYLPFI